MIVMVVLFGGALVDGVLDGLTGPAVVVALVFVLVVRSALSASVALGRSATWPYALRAEPFEGAEVLWATVALTIVLSVVVHRVAATPVLYLLDDRRRWCRRRRATRSQRV